MARGRGGRGFGGRGFGGRGRGFGGRRGFGHRGFGRRGLGRGRGGRDLVNEFEQRINQISLSVFPPLLFNGMLTIAGKDTSVVANLDTFNLDVVPNYQPQNQEMSQNMMKFQELEVFHEPY